MLRRIVSGVLAGIFFLQNLSWAMPSFVFGVGEPKFLGNIRCLPMVKALVVEGGTISFAWEENNQWSQEEFLKAFFTALQVKDKHFWVDLGLFKSVNDILDPALDKTVIGKIFLQADLQLKNAAVKWLKDRTFESEDLLRFRLWIVPEKIVIGQIKDRKGVVIHQVGLRVQVEMQDGSKTPDFLRGLADALTKEVNNGKEFTNLRRIFRAIALAKWYKLNAKPSWPYYELLDKDVINQSLLDSTFSKFEALRHFGGLVFRSLATGSTLIGGGVSGQIAAENFAQGSSSRLTNLAKQGLDKVKEGLKESGKKLIALTVASSLLLNAVVPGAQAFVKEKLNQYSQKAATVAQVPEDFTPVTRNLAKEFRVKSNFDQGNSYKLVSDEANNFFTRIWNAFVDVHPDRLAPEELLFIETKIAPALLEILRNQGPQGLPETGKKILPATLFLLPKNSPMARELIRLLTASKDNRIWLGLSWELTGENAPIDFLPTFPLVVQLPMRALVLRYIYYGENYTKEAMEQTIEEVLNFLKDTKLVNAKGEINLKGTISLFDISIGILFCYQWVEAVSSLSLSQQAKLRRQYFYQKLAKIVAWYSRDVLPIAYILSLSKGGPGKARVDYMRMLLLLNEELGKENKSIPLTLITGLYTAMYANYFLGDIALMLAEGGGLEGISKNDQAVLEMVLLHTHPEKALKEKLIYGKQLLEYFTIKDIFLSQRLLLGKIAISLLDSRRKIDLGYYQIRNQRWNKGNAWILSTLALLDKNGEDLNTVIQKLKRAGLNKGDILSFNYLPFWLVIMANNKLEKTLNLLKKAGLIVDPEQFTVFLSNTKNNQDFHPFLRILLYLLKKQSDKTGLIQSIKMSIGMELPLHLRAALFNGKMKITQDMRFNQFLKNVQEQIVNGKTNLTILWNVDDTSITEAIKWLREQGFIYSEADKAWIKQVGRIKLVIGLQQNLFQDDRPINMATSVIMWSQVSVINRSGIIVALDNVDFGRVDRMLSYRFTWPENTLLISLVLKNDPFTVIKFFGSGYLGVCPFLGVRSPKEAIKTLEIFGKALSTAETTKDLFAIMRTLLDKNGLKHITLPNEADGLFFIPSVLWEEENAFNTNNFQNPNKTNPTFRRIFNTKGWKHLLIGLTVMLALTGLPSMSFAAGVSLNEAINRFNWIHILMVGLLSLGIGIGAWSKLGPKNRTLHYASPPTAEDMITVLEALAEEFDKFVTDSEPNPLRNWIERSRQLFPNEQETQISYVAWELKNHPQFYELFDTVVTEMARDKKEAESVKKELELAAKNFEKHWQKKLPEATPNKNQLNPLRPGGVDLRRITLEPWLLL